MIKHIACGIKYSGKVGGLIGIIYNKGYMVLRSVLAMLGGIKPRIILHNKAFSV